MRLDGFWRNPQGASYLLVRRPLGNQLDDAALPCAHPLALRVTLGARGGLIQPPPAVQQAMDVSDALRGLWGGTRVVANRKQERPDFWPLVENRAVDVVIGPQDFAKDFDGAGPFVRTQPDEREHGAQAQREIVAVPLFDASQSGCQRPEGCLC